MAKCNKKEMYKDYIELLACINRCEMLCHRLGLISEAGAFERKRLYLTGIRDGLLMQEGEDGSKL